MKRRSVDNPLIDQQVRMMRARRIAAIHTS
jgi:hypothetical protein